MRDNIYEALRESHEIQRALFRKLLRSKPGDARKALFDALRIELGPVRTTEGVTL